MVRVFLVTDRSVHRRPADSHIASVISCILPQLVACTSTPTYPGAIVLGTLDLTAGLASSTCPFDAWDDGGLQDVQSNGTLAANGPGLSPTGIVLSSEVSITPSLGQVFLTIGTTQHQGSIDGRSLALDALALRSVCGNVLMHETLSAQLYGPPEPFALDGGCPLLAGEGQFADGGVWPLALPQLPDGGTIDGGTIDGGMSPCFAPVGFLPGASLSDTFEILPDAGPDGGSFCASSPGLLSCTTSYAALGTIQP